MHGILKANAPRGRGKKEDDMQPPSTLLLSTGEFARMCNVSKELLIHYDKLGLLKPKVIGKNGYRYYSLKQLYLMDAIRFFLDTGMSMKEVKTYLDNRTTDLFLEATQAGIEAAELVVVSRCVDIEVRAAYGKYDQLVRIASDCGAKVLDTVYDDAVTLRLRMLDGTQEPLLLKITELERGQERVRVSEPLEAAF